MSNDSIRDYRRLHEGDDLAYFTVRLMQTDLSIGIDRTAFTAELERETERKVIKLRAELETYIMANPAFQASLEPVALTAGAPEIARSMAAASAAAGVGPMAAVAGAIAEEIGRYLMVFSKNVIVENGGDLFIQTEKPRIISVLAGDSPFSGRIGIKVTPEESPLGICTSSGTVGPSLSFGTADAALVKARSAYLADAVASGVGNRVRDKKQLDPALEYGQRIAGVTGLLIIKEDCLAAWGDIELVRL